MKSTQMAGSECKAATGAAFNVYELGLKLNSMMDESFENEREVLKEFRETLGDMIAKREAKLNAMEAQLVGVSFSFKEQEAFYIPVNHDDIDGNIKLDKEKVLFEKLTGVAKAKRMTLRKIGWGKQLRQQLRAFTALK